MDNKPTERTFEIARLSESELNFIVNAVFQVQINAKDAKLVSELQQRLIAILTEPPPVPNVADELSTV